MGWPMLSAIVVNKPNVQTGDMEPETLRGFVAAARELGYPITDQVAFLKEQQHACSIGEVNRHTQQDRVALNACALSDRAFFTHHSRADDGLYLQVLS
jgi:hypothetical protein